MSLEAGSWRRKPALSMTELSRGLGFSFFCGSPIASALQQGKGPTQWDVLRLPSALDTVFTYPRGVRARRRSIFKTRVTKKKEWCSSDGASLEKGFEIVPRISRHSGAKKSQNQYARLTVQISLPLLSEMNPTVFQSKHFATLKLKWRASVRKCALF